MKNLIKGTSVALVIVSSTLFLNFINQYNILISFGRALQRDNFEQPTITQMFTSPLFQLQYAPYFSLIFFVAVIVAMFAFIEYRRDEMINS
jgi:cytochrome b subunit of formate dehydrogenase